MSPSKHSPVPGQNRAFIDALADLGTDRIFEKDEVIVNEGESGGSLLIIRKGRVQVFSSTSAGRQVLIDEHGPGEYFGEMSLDGHTRSASVRALERTAISIVSRDDALAFIKKNPAWSLDLIFELARRARLATDNFKSLALFDVYGRITRMLLSLAVRSNDTLVIPAMPTQASIGQRVGASREMVGIILRDLESGGYLERSGRSAIIKKPLPKRW